MGFYKTIRTEIKPVEDTDFFSRNVYLTGYSAAVLARSYSAIPHIIEEYAKSDQLFVWHSRRDEYRGRPVYFTIKRGEGCDNCIFMNRGKCKLRKMLQDMLAEVKYNRICAIEVKNDIQNANVFVTSGSYLACELENIAFVEYTLNN